MENEQARLHGEIRRLAREKRAIILAHNYQRYEVQRAADLVGDSLGLSAKAAETDARMIVFAGVHFMAESAKILSPAKKVVMPRADAGCPLANTITVEALRALQAEHPGAPTVCYINTSAADGNMGRYLQTLLPERELILWKGVCPTHHRLKVEHVLEARRRHPGAKFMAHPECRLEVLRLADAVRSTTGFLKYAKESEATEFIVGTETGIIPRLQAENPGKRFYPALETMVCPNMKMTNLEDVLAVLEREDNQIEVDDDIRARAVRALERMLAVT